MKINKSGAALSRIVQIGETLKELSQKSGKVYLPLNRGVNQVVNIDLTEVVKSINFNSPEIQVYPHGAGRPDLRAAINEEFFAGKSSPDNILITAGGMHALDLVAQTESYSCPRIIGDVISKCSRFVQWRAKDMTVNRIYSR